MNRLQTRQIGAAIIWSLICLQISVAPANAGPRISRRNVMIVANDPGGSVSQRAREIRALQRAGTRVEIRRGYCNSACTMYLSLSNLCIRRSVVFGFHGPSSAAYGIALLPDDFERWSRVMADHYPSSIRMWFMREARHITVGLTKVSGREIIRHGIRECGT